MAFTIPSNQNFPTKNQIPDRAILDHFSKQAYLGQQFKWSAVTALADTTETAVYALACPSTSGQSLFVNLMKLICDTASQSIILRAYVEPTISSSGTPRTPLNCRPANTTASIASLGSAPTASANGSQIAAVVAGPLAQSEIRELFILDPGQILLITAQATAAASAIVDLGWYEL